MQLADILPDIEDHLIPRLKLDPWESRLYYHLVRHTRSLGRETGIFGILALADTSGISKTKVRDSVRALHDKGCIQIQERNRNGHVLRVLLPAEIDGLIPEQTGQDSVDVETIDFFRRSTTCQRSSLARTASLFLLPQVRSEGNVSTRSRHPASPKTGQSIGRACFPRLNCRIASRQSSN